METSRRRLGKELGTICTILVCIAILCSPSAPSLAAAPQPQADTGLQAASFIGAVTDLLTGRPVVGARVALRGGDAQTITGSGGAYSLAAPPGEWEVCVSASGYMSMSAVRQLAVAGMPTHSSFAMVKLNPTQTEEDTINDRMRVENHGHDDEDTENVLRGEAWLSAMPSTIRVLLGNGSVVVMDFEEYLKGVVPMEIGAASPYESQKAQAIAARCYAAVAVAYPRHPGQGADICDGTDCQAWSPNHYAATDMAVDQTRGVVATYNGGIISANYFGHCNGHTRNSEDVPSWPGSYVPYLRSVECVCGYTEYYGHGAGMCQRGAMEMARRGARADEIIRHYYTGVVVSNLPPVTPTPTGPAITPVPSPTPTPIPVGTMTYALVPGWNTFSIPFRLSNSEVARVLAPIAGAYDLVEAWDTWDAVTPWMVYDARQPVQYSDLTTLSPKQGMYIRVQRAVTLTLTGQQLTSATDIQLNVGPNLVGFPASTRRAIPAALASIAGKYARVYAFDASRPNAPWLMYDTTWPAALNSLTEMIPGRAYWIWTYEPCTWRVEP